MSKVSGACEAIVGCRADDGCQVDRRVHETQMAEREPRTLEIGATAAKAIDVEGRHAGRFARKSMMPGAPLNRSIGASEGARPSQKSQPSPRRWTLPATLGFWRSVARLTAMPAGLKAPRMVAWTKRARASSSARPVLEKTTVCRGA